ncbi:hypothetical protein D3C85_1101130 [compost metagenome]
MNYKKHITLTIDKPDSAELHSVPAKISHFNFIKKLQELFSCSFFFVLTLWLIVAGKDYKSALIELEDISAIWVCHPSERRSKSSQMQNQLFLKPIAQIRCSCYRQVFNLEFLSTKFLFLHLGKDILQNLYLFCFLKFEL